jgi:hypothetical protein
MTAPTERDPSRKVTISVPAWVAALRDPGIQVVLVLLGIALAGVAMLVLGWRGAARTIYVPFQVPWIVSSSLAGLGVIGFALGAWSIHLGRRQDAANRALVEQLTRDAAELAEDLRTGRRSLPVSRRARNGRRGASSRPAPS